MNPILMTMVAMAVAANPERLVLHEWGTFTAVAGEDGAPIVWNPLGTPSDLPSFVVRTGTRPKDTLRGTIRMETPVVYFYVDKELTASLSVGFPEGHITEWYPFARPSLYRGEGIRWGPFQIKPGARPTLLTESAPSHYYPAREVDSAVIEVKPAWPADAKVQHEKFLFYRGVGTFSLPLRTSLEKDKVRLAGFSGRVILFERKGSNVGLRVVDFDRETLVGRPELTTRVENAHEAVLAMLLRTGLYEKEARAMLATWKPTWFEEGLRALFVLSPQRTDEVLPLTVTPAPTETVRVLVGRIEILTPEHVARFRDELNSTRRLSGQARTAAEDKVWNDFGRFAEPLMTRALATARNAQERAQLEEIRGRWYSDGRAQRSVALDPPSVR